MSGLYLTLLAVLVAGLGARDQATVAGLSLRQGARPGVLIVGLLTSIATAAIAAWLAFTIAPILPLQGRTFLAGMALALAGGESLLLRPRRVPDEPTHSLFALTAVLAAHQLTDAARFLVFGIAVGTHAPLPAAIGGAIAGMLLIGAAWAFPAAVLNPRVRLARRVFGGCLLAIGLYVCLGVIGKV